MKRLLLSVLLALGVTAGTVAARSTGQYVVYGQGTISCGMWLAQRSDVLLQGQHKSWVLGFLSGVGYLASSADLELKPTDHAAVEAWMDQYCTTHPLVTVAEGAHVLIAELRTR